MTEPFPELVEGLPEPVEGSEPMGQDRADLARQVLDEVDARTGDAQQQAMQVTLDSLHDEGGLPA